MAACGGMEGEHAPLGERAGVERRVVAPRRACCERERGCDGQTRSARRAGSSRGRGRRAARRVRGVAFAPRMRGERASQVSGRMQRDQEISSLGSVRVRAVGARAPQRHSLMRLSTVDLDSLRELTALTDTKGICAPHAICCAIHSTTERRSAGGGLGGDDRMLRRPAPIGGERRRELARRCWIGTRTCCLQRGAV